MPLIWGQHGFAFFAETMALDPVTVATLDDLRNLLDDLKRQAGNQHEDLYRLAEELRDRCGERGDEVDPLRLHLSYQKLKRLFDVRAGRERPLDDETTTTLSGVIELVPGVTLADDAVRILIERQEANRRAKAPPIEVAREVNVLEATTRQDAPFDDYVQDIARAASEPVNDRLSGTRSIRSRNSLIAAGKFVLVTGATTIACNLVSSWIWEHRDTLLALAHSMGDDAYWWFRAVLDKVRAYFEAPAPGP